MGQQALNGVFVGSIYALFAVGYTLVFGVLDILNLAHAAVFMLAAFAALGLVEAHVPLWAAMPLAVLIAGIIGIILERIAFRPLRGRADSNIAGLISSLAMATVFESIALQLWGPDISRFPHGAFPNKIIRVGGATASLLQLCIIGLAVILMWLLHILIRQSRLGRQIRAVAESGRAACSARPRRGKPDGRFFFHLSVADRVHGHQRAARALRLCHALLRPTLVGQRRVHGHRRLYQRLADPAHECAIP